MAGHARPEGWRSADLDSRPQTKWSGRGGTFTSPDGDAITIQNGKLVDASLTFSFFYLIRHLDVAGRF